MLDLIVIGGGPSGVAAAAHSLRLGMATAIVAPELGGKVNYRFAVRGEPEVEMVDGADLVHQYRAQIPAERHIRGIVTSVLETEGGFQLVLESGETLEGRAVLLATGAKPRRLFIPAEEALWGRGLSYSAVSHASFFKCRDVAVIGNDYRAQVAALQLARSAQNVYFITPHPATLDGALLNRIQARHNVQVFKGWEPIAVEGQEYVTGISLQNAKGLVRRLRLDGIVVELGLIPDSELLAPLVEREATGHVRVNERARTSHPAIFAAGDVTNAHGELVPIALAEGIKAALSALDYLVATDYSEFPLSDSQVQVTSV